MKLKLLTLLFSLLLFVVTLFGKEEAPKNVEEIQAFVKKTISEFEVGTKEIGSGSPLINCNILSSKYFAALAFLHNIELYFQDETIVEAAKTGFKELQEAFFASLKNERSIEPILTYLETKKKLLPHEKYYLLSFLEKKRDTLSTNLQRRADKLKHHVNLEGACPYTYLEGNGWEKREFTDLTLLSWNVCCLPGPLPSILGGVAPANERVDQIVELIQKNLPDVLCLQEVFDEKIALTLFEKLQNDFSHFYINIAPKNFCFANEPPSLGSGLFVASRVPIVDAKWTLFKHQESPYISRGFFSFSCLREDGFATIVNTHLEPTLADGSEGIHARALQLEEIVTFLQKEVTIKNATHDPFIVSGDLNIEWGSNEPSEILLNSFFFDPYNEKREEVTFENCTHADFTGYLWPHYILNRERTYFSPKPIIYDYILLLKDLPSSICMEPKVRMQTMRLEAHNIKEPAKAISDHQPLLSSISFDNF